MTPVIPYGRHQITKADVDAVVSALNSDFLTQGPLVPKFEREVVGYCSGKFAVATNSATSALHVACLALGLGPDDALWTSAITFVASANCARYCGASVDFVDIDPATYNMCAEKLAEKLKRAEEQGKLPKIVVPVHMCGQSCDMVRIWELSKRYGFKVIEDASHAIGGKYRAVQEGEGSDFDPVGSCRFSHVTVFSFHPVKIITTGEGGMALTNDPDIADRMQRFRSHGITSDRSQMASRPADEIWNYQQVRLGYNYRMTDLQAALGLSQITRLDDYVAERHRIAHIYRDELKALPVILPQQSPKAYSSLHLFPIRISRERSRKSQRQVYEACTAAGIWVNIHYIPVYRQPYYESLGFQPGYCPEAEAYFKETLTLPLFPGLTRGDQGRVICVLKEILLS